MNIVRQIVDRCHVSDSNRKVIYYAISRLKKGHKTFWAMPKRERRNFMLLCIKEHSLNKQMYNIVTGGMK